MLVAFGAVVAARFLVLLGGLGAFVVLYLAVGNPTPGTLIAAAIYNCTVFLPLVWLAHVAGRGG